MLTKLRLLCYLSFTVLISVGCGINNDSSTVNLNTSVQPAEGGEVTPKAGEFKEEEEITLNAKPATGFVFERWEGDVTGSDNPSTLILDANKEVTAIFSRKQYDLTVVTEGEGVVNETVVSKAKTSYDHGTTVRLRAQPDWGWHFVEWKGAITGTSNPETVIVDDAKSVTAVFALNEYTISSTVEGEGAIVTDPDKDVFQFGEEVTLIAEAAPGWRLLEWGGDASGDLPEYTVKSISSDLNVSAVFIPVENPLWAMGYNHNGQLGNGDIENQPNPVRQIYEVSSVAAGAYHSLFIKNDGTLWSMGFNNFGQLGNGNEQDQHRPVHVASDVVKVTGGEHHSLFIKSDGTLWAMGQNTDGQLGDGTNISRSVPVQIDSDVIDVSAGAWHTIYVKSDGTLWAMGLNNYGQLGDGTTVNKNTPVLIDTGVAKVGAGKRYSLYIKTNGTLYGMGRNAEGQLGIGESENSDLPRPDQHSPVQIDTNVEWVTAGTDHTLFIKTDGTLWVMGNNETGQLGDGTLENKNVPIQIDSNVTGIAAGNRHSLYIADGGAVYTMGMNETGQLGDGTFENRSVPVKIDENVIDVAAGINHSLYLQSYN